MAKTKTVITAPRQPGTPPAKHALTQPPSVAEEASAPVETLPAQDVEATLSEAGLIEQRLRDGLQALSGEQEGHRLSLEGFPEALHALSQRMQAAERRLTTLQEEAAALPRRLTAAQALLIGVTGSPAEGQAREQIAALQARQHTLPAELAEAEAAEGEMRRATEADRARLAADQATHQAALVDLAALAEALKEQASQARRQVAEAIYASIEAEQQQRQAALDAAEKATAEARAALAALAEDAKARLQQTALDLLLRFQAAYLPVQDAKTERMETVLAYRRAVFSWQAGPSLLLDLPHFWFPLRENELAYPVMQRTTIEEIERALARHVAEQQQRIR